MKRIAAVLLAVSATACASQEAQERYRASQERNPAPCPNVVVLQDAGRFVDFAGEPALETITWSGEIQDVTTACRYFADEPIEAALDVELAIGRGPMADGDVKEVTYFVAITRTNRDLIAKQEFTVPVKFRRGQDVATITESINNIVIPRANETISGINFEIVVGLSVTRDQVLFNRSGESLKFPGLDG